MYLALVGHDRGLFISKLCDEIVAMSFTSQYQFKPGRSRSDSAATWPTVLPEDSGNLFYSSHVFLIDSGAELMSLVLRVKCQFYIFFSVYDMCHFF